MKVFILQRVRNPLLPEHQDEDCTEVGCLVKAPYSWILYLTRRIRITEVLDFREGVVTTTSVVGTLRYRTQQTVLQVNVTKVQRRTSSFVVRKVRHGEDVERRRLTYTPTVSRLSRDARHYCEKAHCIRNSVCLQQDFHIVQDGVCLILRTQARRIIYFK